MFVDDGESLHVCVMGVMRMLMTLCIRVVLAIHFPSSLHQDLNRHWATTFEEEEVRVLKPAALLGARLEEHMMPWYGAGGLLVECMSTGCISVFEGLINATVRGSLSLSCRLGHLHLPKKVGSYKIRYYSDFLT